MRRPVGKLGDLVCDVDAGRRLESRPCHRSSSRGARRVTSRRRPTSDSGKPPCEAMWDTRARDLDRGSAWCSPTRRTIAGRRLVMYGLGVVYATLERQARPRPHRPASGAL